MSEARLHRNTGLDMVRATEAAAISAARWMGLGQRDEADRAASAEMLRALDKLEMDGRIVLGEDSRVDGPPELHAGRPVGTGRGIAVDVVIDPIDGRRLLAQGRAGAVSVAAVATRGSMWSPSPAAYMEKLVVNRAAAAALVPECLDAPAAWTLALIARAKGKAVRDLTVFLLDRPRHHDLLDEIRAAGARVVLADDGDISGAVLAATPDGPVDLLIGVGGAAEGVIAACAVKALGGEMLARLAPQSPEERASLAEAGVETRRILSCADMVAGDQIFFVATGITSGLLLAGVSFAHDRASTNSLILRCETRTRRSMHADHLITAV
ncbi:class II fructose-bisphosphatase [Oscillochloris sp. ZM17-4]|uniref:class II fructose-bisphosphatase n=1 Tax=Oscillochloris sp. ZM17-4 TaxID=2866714 RepID=UPI001C73A05A|nr:class II fructose-bisphosphatase [Oscillochloris sp. ZM17-4]MBX0329130.1 class II fructose-bisphosphatase [Oscillochloris sp. ZM17-4]